MRIPGKYTKVNWLYKLQFIASFDNKIIQTLSSLSLEINMTFGRQKIYCIIKFNFKHPWNQDQGKLHFDPFLRCIEKGLISCCG